MILAAGLGTRLRPLTNDKPKALVEIDGIPLLEIAIRRLKVVGVQSIIINVHHFADKIIDFLQEKKNFGLHIEISDERDALLETGGGLKKAHKFLAGKDSFYLYNADIVSSFDLKAMYEAHLHHDALVTLAVSQRSSSRYLIFDGRDHLCGWMGMKNHELKLSRKVEGQLRFYAFSGIHVIHPRIFTQLTEQGKFSIIDSYRRLAAESRIQAFLHPPEACVDAGKPEQLARAAELLKQVEID